MFAGLTVVGDARRLPRARCEMLIAQAAFAAARDLHAFAVVCEIVQKRFRFAFEGAVDERADRHRNRQIRTTATGFVRLSAGLAGLGCKLPLITKFDQRRKFRGGDEIDAAARAAVAAGRTAFGNIFLTTPRNNSVAAVSGRDGYSGFVNELQCVA
jgi:hypothetical protein